MEQVQQSLVARWNEVLLDAIRSEIALPTPTAYKLYVTHAAIYDAWAAYDSAAYGQYTQIERPEAEHTEAFKAEAVSYAAYRMLSEFYPAQQEKFDLFMQELGYDPANTTTDESTAAGVGNVVARGTLEARANDGSNYENDFADTSGYASVNSDTPGADNAPGGENFDPNRFVLLRVPNGSVVDENSNPIATDDPASYDVQTPLTPHFGGVQAFALESGDQVRPDAPPQLGDFSTYVDALGNVTTNDQAYRDQFGEVLDISGTLTDEQKLIAEFWADGPRTESPPGHWNQIAQDIALREGHGIDEDAKLFFAMNAAQFDAGIAVWDAKYAYDFARPQSAIRDLFGGQQVEAWAGPNQGIQTIDGADWQPYQNTTFVTPAFPEFTSGHSGFSVAAADAIAAFVGSDAYYDGTSLAVYDLDNIEGRDPLGEFTATELTFEDYDGPPITLRWNTLSEAAAESGESRLYGGIHIQDGDLFGRQIGADVAELGQVRWEALFSRGGDDVIVADESGGLLIAGTGNDVVTGSDVEDVIEPGLGEDVITTGGGADIIRGELAALFGDTITDFSAEDQIVFTDVALAQENLSITEGSAILAIDVDLDGEAEGSITLEGDYSNGTFQLTQSDGNTSLSFVPGASSDVVAMRDDESRDRDDRDGRRGDRDRHERRGRGSGRALEADDLLDAEGNDLFRDDGSQRRGRGADDNCENKAVMMNVGSGLADPSLTEFENALGTLS